MRPDAMPERSFLVQRYARINFGAFHLVGYSVAGEETVVQVPELNVCFDVGRCPYFALTSDLLCLSHAHMDHVAGLGYYLSQRHFQGLKPGRILLPRELTRPVDALLQCWRDVERQSTPYELIPMAHGQMFEVRKDFGIRAVATHHGGASLGYTLISIREKLKAEYADRSGPELAAMKRDGVEIQYRLEVPLVCYLGDTTAGDVFDQPDVQNAQVLITECTFFDPRHKAKAKAGRHLHVDHLIELLPRLRNEWIVIGHVSRRMSVRRARAALEKRIPAEIMRRVVFLMDFEASVEGGDIDALVPEAVDAED